MDHRAVGDRHTGTDHHKRLDRDIVAERGVGGEVNRLRRDHGDAGLERRLAQPRLHDLLGFGELGLGVDAAHFVLAGFDHDGLQSQFSNHSYRVGQIILALGVGVTDLFDDFQRPAAIERHHAGVAKRDRAFRRRGVGVLADGDQTVAFDHEPAVAGGIGGAKAEHRQACAFFQRRAQALECHSRDQRRIAEHNQQVIGAARNRLARRQHRMRGAETLALHERRSVGTQPPRLRRPPPRGSGR